MFSGQSTHFFAEQEIIFFVPHQILASPWRLVWKYVRHQKQYKGLLLFRTTLGYRLSWQNSPILSSVHLDEHLIKLVNFVMKAYTPMWFEIKANLYIASGAWRIFKLISMVKQESDEVQKILFPVLQRNEYFALKTFLLPCLQIKMLKSKSWHGGELRKVVRKSRPKMYENSRFQSLFSSAKTTTTICPGNRLM